MVLCTDCSAKLGQELKAWGLVHLAPHSREDHIRRRQAYLRGSKKLEDFDPMANTLQALDSLLQGQYAYLEEEDECAACVLCDLDAEGLIKLAVNNTATKLRRLRGPDN